MPEYTVTYTKSYTLEAEDAGEAVKKADELIVDELKNVEGDILHLLALTVDEVKA